MFFHVLLTQLFLTVSLVDAGILLQDPGYVLTQQDLDSKCASMCRTEVCHIEDETDCSRFITCTRGSRGLYNAIIQPCAFGTFWAGVRKRFVCDLPQNVNCKIDYCRGKQIGDFYDNGGDCKTYWRCGPKGPEPGCCRDGYYFDMQEKRCMVDLDGTCRSKCPLKQDVCSTVGVATEYFDDGNCRTYWDCKKEMRHPVCCPEGQGYNLLNGRCEESTCRDTCPREYQPDTCLQPGIRSYPLYDGLCRTYVKCAAGGQEELWCCKSNQIYNPETQSCEDKPYDTPVYCNDTCPGYNEECNLKPGNRPETFMLGDFEMPCPAGTAYEPKTCSCGRLLDNPPDNSCNIELDIIFDYAGWRLSGSQKAIEINELGTVNPGAMYKDMTSYKFDGNLYYRILYFKQAFPKLYANLVYRPDDSSPNQRRILLSNCMNIELRGPSLELYLQDGRINLVLVTDTLVDDPNNPGQQMYSSAFTSVPYSPGRWNRYRVVYNGKNVYVLNEVVDGEPAVQPEIDIKPLTGAISVAAEGLDIGRCNVHADPNVMGFNGSLAQLQITKCLRQQWINSYNTVAQQVRDSRARSGPSPSPA